MAEKRVTQASTIGSTNGSHGATQPWSRGEPVDVGIGVERATEGVNERFRRVERGSRV